MNLKSVLRDGSWREMLKCPKVILVGVCILVLLLAVLSFYFFGCCGGTKPGGFAVLEKQESAAMLSGRPSHSGSSDSEEVTSVNSDADIDLDEYSD